MAQPEAPTGDATVKALALYDRGVEAGKPLDWWRAERDHRVALDIDRMFARLPILCVHVVLAYKPPPNWRRPGTWLPWPFDPEPVAHAG